MLAPRLTMVNVYGQNSHLIKFPSRRGLIQSDPPGGNFRLVIIFAANRRACQAPQKTNLADVRERVRDRPLKYSLRRFRERRARRQIVIQRLQRGIESLDALVPRAEERR